MGRGRGASQWPAGLQKSFGTSGLGLPGGGACAMHQGNELPKPSGRPPGGRPSPGTTARAHCRPAYRASGSHPAFLFPACRPDACHVEIEPMNDAGRSSRGEQSLPSLREMSAKLSDSNILGACK